MGAIVMSTRFASLLAIAAIFVAIGLGLYGFGHRSDAAASPMTVGPAPALAARGGDGFPSENGGELPPNHPPIGSPMSPHGSAPSTDQEDPSLVWKRPAAWEDAPNASSMRLATYRVPGGAEVSVSRAGGNTEANIQRWVGQFDPVGHQARAEKTSHGVHVITVDLAGTYVGGGMAMGTQTEAHPDWAMVAAIAQGPGLPYFFKMTGPAVALRTARPAFDHLVDSIAPM
jgi:hypothetical protein